MHCERCCVHVKIPLWIGLCELSRLPNKTTYGWNGEGFFIRIIKNILWHPVWIHSTKMFPLSYFTGNRQRLGVRCWVGGQMIFLKAAGHQIFLSFFPLCLIPPKERRKCFFCWGFFPPLKTVFIYVKFFVATFIFKVTSHESSRKYL